MPRPRPTRRAQRQAPAARRPVRPPAVPAGRFRAAWATAEDDLASHQGTIGKVVRFGDAPRAGRVKDVIFELETGEVLAYEVDPGDGSACFVAADMLERETPSTLHFAGASPASFGEDDADEFFTLEHLPGSDDR